MTWPVFQTAYLESSTQTINGKRWFLIEIYLSSDGPRTRLCEGRYETMLEAEEERLKREAQSHA